MTDRAFLHRRADTFGKVMESLLHDQEVTDGAVRLYAHLHWRCGDKLRRSTIAEALGISETTVTNRARELELKDWIIVRSRTTKHGRVCNFYHVFEAQEDCRQFRAERNWAKPEGGRIRRSRKGVGGRPSHKPKETQVEEGPNELEFTADVNLSSHPIDPDSSGYPEFKKAIPDGIAYAAATASTPPTHPNELNFQEQGTPTYTHFVAPGTENAFTTSDSEEMNSPNPPVPATPLTRIVNFHDVREHYNVVTGKWNSDEYVYIGRSNVRNNLADSGWGNPFKMELLSDREKVIKQYRQWLLQDKDLMAQIPALRGKVLVCWCSPDPCHGDVLAELANMPEAEFQALLDSMLPPIDESPKPGRVISYQRVAGRLHDDQHIYVGKETPWVAESRWKARYLCGDDGTREEVTEKSREAILSDPELLAALPEVRGKPIVYHHPSEAAWGAALALLAAMPDEEIRRLAKARPAPAVERDIVWMYASHRGATKHAVRPGEKATACGQLLTHLLRSPKPGVEYRACKMCEKALNSNLVEPGITLPNGGEGQIQWRVASRVHPTKHAVLPGRDKSACGIALAKLPEIVQSKGEFLHACKTCEKALNSDLVEPEIGLINAYHYAIPEPFRPPGKPAYGRNRPIARAMLAEGITIQEVAQYVAETYPGYLAWANQESGRPKLMSLEHVSRHIKASRASRHGANGAMPEQAASPVSLGLVPAASDLPAHVANFEFQALAYTVGAVCGVNYALRPMAQIDVLNLFQAGIRAEDVIRFRTEVWPTIWPGTKGEPPSLEKLVQNIGHIQHDLNAQAPGKDLKARIEYIRSCATKNIPVDPRVLRSYNAHQGGLNWESHDQKRKEDYEQRYAEEWHRLNCERCVRPKSECICRGRGAIPGRVKDAWLALSGQLQIQLNASTFAAWVQRLDPVRFEPGRLVVEAPHGYAAAWVNDHLLHSMAKSFNQFYRPEQAGEPEVAIECRAVPEPLEPKLGEVA